MGNFKAKLSVASEDAAIHYLACLSHCLMELVFTEEILNMGFDI